jgi:hypothetical protein
MPGTDGGWMTAQRLHLGAKVAQNGVAGQSGTYPLPERLQRREHNTGIGGVGESRTIKPRERNRVRDTGT